jgi:hypothetical protein
MNEKEKVFRIDFCGFHGPSSVEVLGEKIGKNEFYQRIKLASKKEEEKFWKAIGGYCSSENCSCGGARGWGDFIFPRRIIDEKTGEILPDQENPFGIILIPIRD